MPEKNKGIDPAEARFNKFAGDAISARAYDFSYFLMI